jgi:hypothetical protein
LAVERVAESASKKKMATRGPKATSPRKVRSTWLVFIFIKSPPFATVYPPDEFSKRSAGARALVTLVPMLFISTTSCFACLGALYLRIQTPTVFFDEHAPGR